MHFLYLTKTCLEVHYTLQSILNTYSKKELKYNRGFFFIVKKIPQKYCDISTLLNFKILKIKFLFSEIHDIIHVLTSYVLEFWLKFCFQELKNQILLEANPLQNTRNENENCRKSVYWHIKCIIYNNYMNHKDWFFKFNFI